MLVGRHLTRPKAAAARALVFEVSGDRDRRLWLDAGPGTAGLYLLTRDEALRIVAAAKGEIAGATRHALLLFRKHLSGARVTGLRRVEGERTLVLEAGPATVALRLRGRHARPAQMPAHEPWADLADQVVEGDRV